MQFSLTTVLQAINTWETSQDWAWFQDTYCNTAFEDFKQAAVQVQDCSRPVVDPLYLHS
jgi:hypothetical protein